MSSPRAGTNAPIERQSPLRAPTLDEAREMFDGHFPGHPVLPGARLLDMVLASIGADSAVRADGEIGAAGVDGADRRTAAPLQVQVQVQVVKFLAPVMPGTLLSLHWREHADGRITFECRDGTRRVASGSLSRGSPGGSSPGPSSPGRHSPSGAPR
ncbi:MAG: hypothetical protein AB7L76_23625 [Burkholderiaceae bacterium]